MKKDFSGWEYVASVVCSLKDNGSSLPTGFMINQLLGVGFGGLPVYRMIELGEKANWNIHHQAEC